MSSKVLSLSLTSRGPGVSHDDLRHLSTYPTRLPGQIETGFGFFEVGLRKSGVDPYSGGYQHINRPKREGEQRPLLHIGNTILRITKLQEVYVIETRDLFYIVCLYVQVSSPY